MIAQGIAAAHGQGLKQVGELLIAFGLSSIVGLERHLRGKSAGLRTQAIVGTASALFLMVSKYGFGDVISPGQVLLDPSRVAGQVVSGVGFLGAGLIITRRGAIRGLTTAAAVWETSAIGMAAGAGLPLLAGVVTGLHFVTVLGYTRVIQWLPGSADDTEFAITYLDGRGPPALRTPGRSPRWLSRTLQPWSAPDRSANRAPPPPSPDQPIRSRRKRHPHS